MTRLFITLYLIALLIRPQDWLGPVMGMPTTSLITLPMFIGGLVVYLREPARYSMPHNWLLPCYIVFIFLSTTVMANAGEGLDQAVTFLKRTLALFPVVWLLNTPDKVQYAVKCFVWIVIFLAFQAILEATTGTSWGGMTPMPGYQEIRVRWHGDWDGPNVFAILFLIGLAFIIEYLFGPGGMLRRLWAAAAFGLACVAIYFTNSRGAMLALMAMLAFYFKDRFSKPVALGLVVVAVLGVTVLGPSRMSEVNTKEESAAERAWLWEQGLTMLRESPVLGVGRGQFTRRSYTGLLAHNNYVQNFAEMGLPGFFMFVAMIWFCWRAGTTLARQKTLADSGAASLGRMILGMVIAYGVVTFFVVMELEVLYFVIGLSMAGYLSYRHVYPSDLPLLRMTWREAAGVCAVMGTIITAIYLIAFKSIV